jgi:hypothetical protein
LRSPFPPALAPLLLAVSALTACDPQTPDAAAPDSALADTTIDTPIDTTPDGQPDPPEAPLVPPPPALTRLTVAQLRHALTDLLGEGLALPSALEPDAMAEGLLTAGGAVTTVSPRGVELYEDAARSLGAQVVASRAHRDRLAPCAVEVETNPATGPACLDRFLRDVGRRAWRRPLSDDEVTNLAAIGAAAQSALGSFDAGLAWTLAALLQSPSFLYRLEVGEPEPDAPGAVRRYTSLEMASRLAFFLWASPPDDALLDAGERGELVTDAGLEAAIDRLLADPRAHRALRAFFGEWLQLHKLKQISKDPNIFRHFSPDLGDMAAEETLLLVDRLIGEEDADLRNLLLTRSTSVNRRLAAIYNIRAPAAEGFARVDLPPASPRRGLLGHVSFLALHAHPTSSSATLRGVSIRQMLMCEPVPPPPSELNTAIPEPSPELPTLRDRLAAHRSDPSCAGCHALTDIPGLGLENFDGLGRYRETEQGARIDATGRLGAMDFDGPSQLAEALAYHPNFAACAVRKLYTFAVARPPTGGEDSQLEALLDAFIAGDHRVATLQRAIALSPGFRSVGAGAP